MPSAEMLRVLDEGLRAALEMTNADMGDIQLADRDGVLTLAAHSGFDPPLLQALARLDRRGDGVCARALRTRRRVAVEDTAASALFAQSTAAPVLLAAGVRAVQSTPLEDDHGTLIGMFSTYYRDAHPFGEAAHRPLDMVATRLSLLILRARLEERLRQTTSTLEHEISARARALEEALDGASAGTWHVDLTTNTVKWDERSRAMFHGRSLTYPFDPSFPEVHPDDRARVQAHFTAMESAGEDQWDVTFRTVHPDGTIKWVRGVGRAERDSSGHLRALNGINLDLTAAKLLESELQAVRSQQSEAAEMVERLLGGAAEGILAATESGDIERANAALEAMFGYGPGELTGQPLALLIPEGVRARHAMEHRAFWAAPRSRPMGEGRDLRGRRKDGSTFPVEVTLTHLMNTTGGRALAFVTDITRRKDAEDELRRSNETLREQASQLRRRTEQLRRLASDLTLSEQQAREHLARTVHDGLQQFLFSAKLRVDRLMAASAGRNDVGHALIGQVRDDLELAIAAARSLSVELFPPTLHQQGLSAGILWLAHWMLDRYGLTVDVTAEPAATLDEKDLRTLAFESVRELLFDVVKHARVNRATVTVDLTPDAQVRIVVADAGVGFNPPDVLNPMQPSTGWGLLSIRERATLLGGQFDIDSAPGRGSRFTLVVPRTGTARLRPPRPLRILIADDHAGAREAIRELFARRPEFDVVGEATTGTEAVVMAKALQPDAIIMDVSMPGDGIEATRRLQAECPATQIFALSTQERQDAPHAIETAGAVDYFTKGDDVQQLVDRLVRLHASLARR